MTDVRDTHPDSPETEADDTALDLTPAGAENDAETVDTTVEDDEDGEPVVPSGRITLAELNEKTPADLVAFAEQLEVENASNLRKQDLLFAILKALAEEEVEIIADGVLEADGEVIYTCNDMRVGLFGAKDEAAGG